MKHMLLIPAILFVAFLVRSEASWAQGGDELFWRTVDGGGTTFSTGGNYTLGGTTGQPDAGKLSGRSYTLNGGFFWSVGAVTTEPQTQCIYLPILLKGH